MSPLKNKFWKKPKYVNLYESKGSTYSYYRRQGLQFKIEGEPGTKEWLDNYEEIHAKFDKDKTRSGPTPGSVDAMIIAYKQSGRYRVLAQSTKDRYEFALARLSKAIGQHSLASITRRVVVRLQEKIAETQPRTAIEVIKVLDLVFKCAINLGEVDANPAEKMEKPPAYKAKQHEAWTDEQIAAFLAGAKPVWRRAVMLALYTGLRRGDLIRLTKGHVKGDWIKINIQKTDDEAEIPIHSKLAAELELPMPNPSLMLIPTARGRQMNKDSLSHGIQKECKRLGIVPNPPLHGLRRSAIIRLLEVGCSVEEVKAITEQSKSMIEYYAGRRHKRALAKVVKIKMEQTPDKSV